MAPVDTVQRLRGGGFSEEEIAIHIGPEVDRLRDGGFSENEIATHFQIPTSPPFDPTPIREHFAQSNAEASGEEGVDLTFMQSMEAGFQQSLVGLASREALPDILVPEDASTADRITSQMVAVGLDLPFFAAGAFAAGGPASPITAVGGAFALPAALREVLTRTYRDGRIETADQFMEVLSATAIEEFKGFTTGLAVGAVGPAAATATAAKLGARAITPLASTAAARASEVAAMVTVSSALEGRIPNAHEFTDAAVVIGLLTGARKLASSLHSTYAKAGRKPMEVAEDAKTEHTIQEDLASVNHNKTPRAYKEVKDAKPEEVTAEVEAKAGKEVTDILRGKEVEIVEIVEVVKDKPLTEKTLEELQSDLKMARETDSQLLERLFGSDGAKRYSRLQRKANSKVDFEGADRAFIEIENMEATLTGAERNQLFGIGETTRTIEEIQAVERGVLAITGTDADAQSLSQSLKFAVTELPSPEAAKSGRMTLSEEVAVAQFSEAQRVMQREGIDPAEVTALTLKASASRFADPADAEFMLNRFLSKDQPEPSAKGITPQTSRGTLEIEPGEAAKAGTEVTDVLRGKDFSFADLQKEMRAATEKKRLFREGGIGGAEPVAPAKPEKVETALDKVKERISFEEKQPRKTVREKLDSLYADWFREQHPLQQAVAEMANGAEIPITQNAAKLMQLEPGVIARAGHFLEYSPLEFETFKRVGRPLKDILDPAKSEMDNLAAYLVARRTIELGPGKKKTVTDEHGNVEDITPSSRTGVDMDVARKAVAEGQAKFEAISQELVEFQGHVLAYLRDAGVISPESFDLMRAAGKDYVPLNRSFAEDAVPIATRGAGKKARNPIFRFRGEDRPIVDPIESILKNTYTFIQIAERNNIGLQLVRQAEATGRTDVAKKVTEAARPITVGKAEIKSAIKKWEAGSNLSAKESQALESFAETEFAIFRKNGLTPKENQIAVFDQGVKTIWEIDPEVYRSFTTAGPESNNIVFRAASGMARLTRAGSIFSPEFVGRNPLRDQFTAYIISENKLRIMVDFMNGIGSVVRKDKAYQDWLMSGGPQAALVSLDRQYLQKNVRDLMQDGMVSTARNVVKNPIEMMKILSELSESGTRVGEFKRAMKGKTRTKENFLKGGLDSRNVTLDFSQMGTQARALNQIIPFFAASLNGTDRMVRAFKDTPLRTTSRVAASITVPSILLYLHNREQDWYKDMNDWEKDFFWPIKPTNDPDGIIYRVPKPFELGVLFGTGAERIVEGILSQDPKAFDGFMESVMNSSTPSLVPAIATPVIETFANRKIFFDTPVIPGYLEGQLPEYQYKTYTTELTKALGGTIAGLPGMKNSISASPLVIENFVSAWTGGVGRHVLNAVDFALRKAGALPDPVLPASTLADIPFVKAFIVRHPSMGTQPIQDFFEQYNENETVIRTIRRLAKEGDVEAAQREMDIAGPSGQVPLNGIRDTISGLSSLIRLISSDQFEGTREEKRQLVDNYYIMANQIAKQGLEQLEVLEKLESQEATQ